MWAWWQPPCLLKTVIVNLKDDTATSLRGVLWQTRGPWWTLRSVALLHAQEASVPMGLNVVETPIQGDAIVHRDNIAFVQVVF